MAAPPAAAPPNSGTPVYLTHDLPGLGGTIRERPEDFLVDEQPAYQPCGEGEHIYLFVEKRNMSTFMAARTLARHFGVHESAVHGFESSQLVGVSRQASPSLPT